MHTLDLLMTLMYLSWDGKHVYLRMFRNVCVFLVSHHGFYFALIKQIMDLLTQICNILCVLNSLG